MASSAKVFSPFHYTRQPLFFNMFAFTWKPTRTQHERHVCVCRRLVQMLQQTMATASSASSFPARWRSVIACLCACAIAGAAAAAGLLPEPGGEAAGEPESQQQAAGGRRWQGGGAGRGGPRRAHAARGTHAAAQRPDAVPGEDGRHRGLIMSEMEWGLINLLYMLKWILLTQLIMYFCDLSMWTERKFLFGMSLCKHVTWKSSMRFLIFSCID